MQKSIVSALSVAVVLVVASGVALAQTYPPPAQTPPAQTPPAQTQPAQAPPAQTPPAQAPAQTAPGSTGQMPSVANLKPFSIEANFMSLPGYLRYLMHQQTGQWMTYAEAQRAVKQGQ